MQRKKMITALALLAVASLLLVVTMGAVAQSQKSGKLENVNPADMDTMYHTVVMTGMNSESLTFNVLNSVVKNKDGSVMTKDLTQPMTVQYFYANDTVKHGVDGGLNEFGGYSRMDYDSATINVAGASAVLAAKDFTLNMRDTGAEFQVASFSVYMPDGTVKSYKLDTPIKATMSLDSKTMTTTGSPQLRAALQDIFKEDTKFPANAVPVKIKDIDTKIK